MSQFTPTGCAWIIVGVVLIICGFMTGGVYGVVFGTVGCCFVIGSHQDLGK